MRCNRRGEVMLLKRRGRGFLLILVLLSGFHCEHACAQKYGNSLGVRIADGNVFRSVGLTFQQRVLKDITIEGILESDFNHNTLFHAMIERHSPIITKRLNYYVGTGLSLGNEQSTFIDDDRGYRVTSYGNATFGADLIAGLEITLLKYNISIDYKPNFNLTGRESWYQGEVAVSARAVIMTGAEYDKKRRVKQRTKRQESRTKQRAKKKEMRVERRQGFLDGLKQKS